MCGLDIRVTVSSQKSCLPMFLQFLLCVAFYWFLKIKTWIWMAVLPCLGKVRQSFLLCPVCPICTAYCHQLRQEHFLTLWLTFATKKVSSMWSFFDVHHLLWSKCVLPEADISLGNVGIMFLNLLPSAWGWWYHLVFQ